MSEHSEPDSRTTDVAGSQQVEPEDTASPAESRPNEPEEREEPVLPTAPRTHAESVLALAQAMRRYAMIPGAVVAALAVVVFGVVLGQPGLFGALIGGVVGFGSSLGTLWLMRKSAAAHPYMAMAVALGGFVGKLILLLLVMMALREVTGIDHIALSMTMLLTVMVWAGAELVAFRKTKIPTIIPS
ncbi:hypothetical protein EV191_10221 [Tamaricihabitans halophyticus]|uniref:ATP synthase protein I n=1 Tax=Tamaricihabitans halophyticus TaxID=1262583 RepID=A0A4R2QXE0_9PSEU|nr:hypothetical protein [Tamaricihabitans halophyticus]TCP54813.1 hypothetical protein EV191_10221 [Tamaricihabitans halophyticus]